MSIGDVYEATNLIHGVVDYSANIIWGTNTSPDLQDEVIITIIATGFVDGLEKRVGVQPLEQERVECIIPEIKPTIQSVNLEESNSNLVEPQVEDVLVEEEAPKKEIPPFVKKLFGKK